MISLRLWGLLACPEHYCDWSPHNQHSWNVSCVHGFSEFHSNCLPAKIPPKIILVSVPWWNFCDIFSTNLQKHFVSGYKGTKNWLKHRIDLKQQHHCDITPCSFYVSLWTGSLFGERVQKSQEEGRERVRACRQTSGTVVQWHPPCIRSWCKLLLARILIFDRFDLHSFFGQQVAYDLI